MMVGIQTGGILERYGVDGGFRVLHEAGFDCVDFGYFDYMSVGDLLKGERKSILDRPMDEIYDFFRPFKEAAARWNIRFYQTHAPFSTFVKDNPEVNEYLLTVMDKCAQVNRYFDCRYMVVHPAFNAYADRMEYDDEWNLNIERYSRMIPALKRFDVICCLENMFVARQGKIYEACMSDMNEAAAYIDELNTVAGEKRFAFCYDTGHGLLVGRDPYGSLLQLGDRLEAVHIHDNNGWEDQHIAPYMGKLDWDRFVRGMKAIGYKGALCFESGNTTRMFDPELTPMVLRLTAETGKMFARRIEAE